MLLDVIVGRNKALRSKDKYILNNILYKYLYQCFQGLLAFHYTNLILTNTDTLSHIHHISKTRTQSNFNF